MRLEAGPRWEVDGQGTKAVAGGSRGVTGRRCSMAVALPAASMQPRSLAYCGARIKPIRTSVRWKLVGRKCLMVISRSGGLFGHSA